MTYTTDLPSGRRDRLGESTKNGHSATITATSSMREDEPMETSPLLASKHGEPHMVGGLLPGLRKVRSPNSIMLIMFLVLALVSFGDQISESPLTRVFESIICYRYYEENDPSKIKLGRAMVGPGAVGGVDEMYCKADDVQDELAMLVGYQSFFDGFPFLLLAVPFGWAADRYGRWPFIMLNLVQIVVRAIWLQIVPWNWQVFDIRTVWFASAFSLLGGGSPIAANLFFVVISDVTPSEERAANFLRAGAANLSANLIMPPLAATLMEINPWIPIFLGTAFYIVAMLCYLFAPETLNYRENALRPEECAHPPPDMTTAQETISANFGSRWYRSIKSNISFLTSDWRVPALISTFSVHILIGSIGRLLLQYVSKRYALTLSEATILATIRNGVNVLLLFVILPYLAKIVMHKFGWCSQLKDLYLGRASLAFVALGWLGVAASPNIPSVAICLSITSLGAGAALLVRSFLTSILEAHHIAIAYSLISIVDTLGSMFGAPLLARLFKQGLYLGGAWVGLPFFFVAFLASFFTGVLLVVRLKKGESGISENEEE